MAHSAENPVFDLPQNVPPDRKDGFLAGVSDFWSTLKGAPSIRGIAYGFNPDVPVLDTDKQGMLAVIALQEGEFSFDLDEVGQKTFEVFDRHTGMGIDFQPIYVRPGEELSSVADFYFSFVGAEGYKLIRKEADTAV